MQHDIRKDYFWNTVGVFAQSAISPLLLIVITRVNGINDSGLFSFAFSVAIIFWALGMWGGRTFQVSDVKHEFSHRSYIMVRLILAAFMLVTAITFSFVNHYDLTKSEIIVTLVLFKAIESISDAIYGIIQTHDLLFVTGKSLFYKALGGFGLFLAADFLSKSILLGCICIVLANILVVTLYDLRVAGELESININLRRFKEYKGRAFLIMRRCAPIATVIFLSMFSLNIPRYFVDMYHQEEIGYFGIIAMPITLIALLMMFILQPKVVYLSHAYEDRRYRDFNAATLRVTAITIVVGLIILLAAYLLGVQALKIVFGINFSQFKLPLMIIVAGGIINAVVSIVINVLIIVRRFKQQFYILLITNLILVVLSAATIKQFGLLGGVTLFMFTNLVQVCLLAIVYGRMMYRLAYTKG